jgi:hypothetical protein
MYLLLSKVGFVCDLFYNTVKIIERLIITVHIFRISEHFHGSFTLFKAKLFTACSSMSKILTREKNARLPRRR